MKRSEMLAKLAKALETDDPCIGAERKGQELAEIALSLVEQSGMAPPMTTGPSVIGRDSKGRPAGFDLGYLRGCREGHRRLWECEDHELEQLKKELADESWQEPED